MDGERMKPRLLDLFCGAGGCTKGYQDAGFYVVGVDIAPQPNYCGDAFYQWGALEFLRYLPQPLFLFDAIHASPPCQAHTTMSNRWRGQGGKADEHLNLIPETRELLKASGLPWVIENVVGAKRWMESPLTLHGGMFGLGVHRPRLFESNVLLHAWSAAAPTNPVGVYGQHHDGRLLWRRADGSEQRAARTLEEARVAMGVDWMEWRELAESIPPAYAEYIGRQLLAFLEVASGVA
jgi:DNA (cytosine-5)-methyltransferase 1